MNPFPDYPKKTTTQRLSLAALLATTVVTTNAADLHVPADYATIQAAVDAANLGDTIHIAAGVYVEQVTIAQKDLTLIGQPGTILRAFPNMAPGGGGETQWRPVLFVFQSSDVVLRDLAFEGDQLADQQVRGLVGVAYYDSGGTVEDCRFTGFREKVPGSKEGAALRFLNDLPGASLLNVRAVGNTIEDSYVGIVVFGAPDKTSYNFTVEDNTIHGVSTSTTAPSSRRGVDLGDGITGSVTGNSISGFSYSGAGDPYPYAWGILAIGGTNGNGPTNSPPLDFIRFENNSFRDNNQHLMLVRANNNEILNNHFEGTGLGQRPAGLWFSGENVRVQGNVFRDMEEGIRVGGMDPDWQTILGVATNAMLVDNRFCGVINSINMQPQATATETATLTCPFPAPALNILSWPGIEEGFSVESALAPSGPWDTLDAAPTRQNGQNSVVVPADANQQFFRLAKP